MKKAVTKAVAVAALAAMMSAPAVQAAEATVGADVASAYVFRGTTFNDGLVLQPYVEVSGLPIDIGVWGNIDIDDNGGTLEEGQFSEVDVYFSYALPIDGIDASIGYCEYMYPGFGGAALGTDATGMPTAEATQGEADREVSLSVGLDLPLAPSVGVYYGIDGGIDSSLYADVSVGHDLELSEDLVISLGALVGYMDPDGGESGFSHYEISAGIGLLDWLSLSAKFIDEIDDDVLTVDEDLVFTLGASHSF